MTETVDDLLPYVLCAIPGALVTVSWFQFHRQVMTSVSSWRRRLALASLLLSTISSLILVLFPGVLQYLESAASESGDGWYFKSVQMGFLTGVGAAATSPFAVGRLRVLLVVSGLLVSGLWFLVGTAY